MKSQNKILRKRRAVSPVIATVILVAVTITVAVAVSYWMSGISSQYTKFEKIEIQSGWSVKDSTNSRWIITMELKNSGTTDATLTRCFVNDIPLNVTGYDAAFTDTTAFAADKRVVINFAYDTGMTLDFGEAATVKLYISFAAATKWRSLSSGTTVNLKLHSAAGMDYIRLVPLV